MLEEKLGYKFTDSDLLALAITRTAAIEENLAPDLDHKLTFSRLKFLGGHVLGLLISDLLFATELFNSEGKLTVAHSRILSHNGLIVQASQKIGLDSSLIFGRGEKLNSIQANGKVLFTHIQALFGAIWIDSQANYFVVLSVLLNILSVSDVTHVNRLIGVPDGLILPSKLNQLQINFGHTFNNNNLILNALIRPSALEEEIIDAKTSFQTLEFLGDKVFGCIIAEWLMSKLESVDSDILTPLFNKFVSNSQLLPMIAKNINLCESLIMGVGEEKVGVRLNSHRLADHMEALVAALWLDVSQDYQKTKERIVNLFHFELEKLLIRSYDMTPSVLTDTASFPPLPNNVSMHNKPSKKLASESVKSYKEALIEKNEKLMTKKKTEQKYVFISLPFWSSRDKKGPVPIGIKVDKNRESLLDADSFERVGKNYNC